MKNGDLLGKTRNFRKIYVAVIVILVMVLIILSGICFNFNDKNYIITVTDKERIITYSEETPSSKYLVFGDDETGETVVFENTDCLFRGKWNSSDVQGMLKEGKTYKVTVVGYRVPFLSWYENIIRAEEVR